MLGKYIVPRYAQTRFIGGNVATVSHEVVCTSASEHLGIHFHVTRRRIAFILNPEPHVDGVPKELAVVRKWNSYAIRRLTLDRHAQPRAVEPRTDRVLEDCYDGQHQRSTSDEQV